MAGGAFTPQVRAAILDATLGRCAGCSRPVDEVHHRCPRRAGGTSNRDVGEPFNGLGLCRTHHAWAESHRAHAARLGWLTGRPNPDAPFWTRLYGWCSWVLLDDGPPCWCTTIHQPPPGPDAHDAVRAFLRQGETRS